MVSTPFFVHLLLDNLILSESFTYHSDAHNNQLYGPSPRLSLVQLTYLSLHLSDWQKFTNFIYWKNSTLSFFPMFVPGPIILSVSWNQDLESSLWKDEALH